MIKNVVTVVVDALRWDRVGLYNDEHDLTPNIDYIGREGVFVENAFTHINTTDPAVTSLQTGLHPQSHGLINHGQYVTDAEKQKVTQVPQLQEVLQEDGLTTVKTGRSLGRWHKSGFDYISGEDNSGQMIKSRLGDYLHKVDDRLARRVKSQYYSLLERLESDAGRTRAKRGEIDELLGSIDDDSPFYGFVHLMDTHERYDPRQELRERYQGRYESESEQLSDVVSALAENSQKRQGVLELEDETTAERAACYDGAVKEADEKVGCLIEGLKEKGLFNETLLIVLADHGESLTEHNILYDHHGLYECTVRIPMVLHVPGQKQGHISDFVQISDITPTILDYLGIDPPREFDGISLKPLIDGEQDGTGRSAVVAEEAHAQRKRMVRTETYKSIWALEDNALCRYCGIEHGDPEEFYDLAADPEETTDISDDHPEKIRELQDLSESIHSEFSEPDIPTEPIGFDDEEEVIQRMKDLGYY